MHFFYLANKLSVLIMVCVLVSLSGETMAQSQFQIDAQYRPRFEVRRGYQQLARPGDVPAVFVSQRTRLKFSYQTEMLRLVFSPQDVRVWGDEQNVTLAGNTGDNASLDMHEGYLELRLAPSTKIRVGRQELSYDNEWLLGTRNWNQNGIASDAVLLESKIGQWDAHAGFSWNTLKEALSDNPYPPNRYKALGLVWVHRQLGQGFSLSALHLVTGQTPSDTVNNLHFRQTSGFYLSVEKKPFIGRFNIYYQYGSNFKGRPVSAWMTAADMALRTGRFTLGTGWSYLSGQPGMSGNSGSEKVFDMVYTARHKFLGFMDYFRNIGQDTRNGGLADVFAYAGYKLSPKTSLENTLHYFSLAHINPQTPEKKGLGFENDLVLKYAFQPWGQFETGYLFFVPAQNLRNMQGVVGEAFSQFFYVQLTLMVRNINEKQSIASGK